MKINTSRRVVRIKPKVRIWSAIEGSLEEVVPDNNSSSNGRADACWGPITTFQADQ
jgi:hypothetical protein